MRVSHTVSVPSRGYLYIYNISIRSNHNSSRCFRPLTGLSLYLPMGRLSYTNTNYRFRPLTGLSLYLQVTNNALRWFNYLFPSPHGVISISTRYREERNQRLAQVSVPSRGYLYIYTIPPFPLKTWPKVPLCGAKRHFRNFHSARQSFFFISPGNMPCGAKLPFYYFNSAHSHIIQLPSVSRTFAYMRRQS